MELTIGLAIACAGSGLVGYSDEPLWKILLSVMLLSLGGMIMGHAL